MKKWTILRGQKCQGNRNKSGPALINDMAGETYETMKL